MNDYYYPDISAYDVMRHTWKLSFIQSKDPFDYISIQIVTLWKVDNIISSNLYKLLIYRGSGMYITILLLITIVTT